jgi:hypothetical protein
MKLINCFAGFKFFLTCLILLIFFNLTSFAQNDITFQVDMSIQKYNLNPGEGDIVIVRGNFNGWSGEGEVLDDPEDDDIYVGTYNVGGNAGEDIQYKFVIHKINGSDFWEENISNRIFTLTGNPETLPVVFFNDNPGQFTQITDGAIVADGAVSLGCSWADYDNDGDLDLYVTNSGDNNFLYQNNNDGTFTQILSGVIVNDGGYSRGTTWGDYDNDGDLDLFVANVTQDNCLYQNNGGGSFTKITDGEIVNDGGSSRSCSWVDYDNDSFLDLFVANSNGENDFLYNNNGDGTFTKITEGEIVNDWNDSWTASWGDYDNDGDQDLFVGTGSGENNILYQNNGDGNFSRIYDDDIVNDGSTTISSSWGDYNNDGNLDLFVSNTNGENNFLYWNNGNGSFQRIWDGEIVNDGGSSYGSSWGDYDNDGFLDLYVVNGGGQENFLYHNNGDGTFQKIWEDEIIYGSESPRGIAWGDYDNDGDLDLFIATVGNNLLYRNNGNSNHWINLLCVGQYSNRSAFGTKVIVRANIFGQYLEQTQEINGQSGYYSQNSANVEFGLGDASTIDEIEIRWPSGIVQILNSIGVDRFLSSVEDYSGPEMVFLIYDSGPGSLREAINIANSDGVPTSIDFAGHLMGKTIKPITTLPALTEDYTTIDGDINDDGLPDIEINPGSPDAINGLFVESAFNTIQGLLINNFYNSTGPGYNGIALFGSNSHHNLIIGCYIGTDLSREDFRRNRNGIGIFNGAHDNVIGGPNPGDRNIINFNRDGVVVNGSGTVGNTITRNSIRNNAIYLVNGGNNEITAPTIISFDGSTLTGNTIPNSTVEIFADLTNFGEEFLGDAISDGSGDFSFSGYFPEDRLYNVTVSDQDGNTSRFSRYIQQSEINANRWRVQLPNNGSYGRDILSLVVPGGASGQGPGGEFPKGSDIYILFSAGQHIGTLKNGIPSVSQSEFGGDDYLPGKIMNTTPNFIEQLNSEQPSLLKNKVYVIDSTRSGNDWDNWPVDDGAPADANGEPLLLSPQDSWSVFNDLYPHVHSGTDDPVLGVEIQRSTYSYTTPRAADAFIVKWKITNKSSNNYTDTYFGAWFDPDVDDPYNDIVGTDTSLSMAFVYNFDDDDAPEAFGVSFLKGPIDDGKTLGLTATTNYPNGDDLQSDEERYNVSCGLDRWGNPKPFGPFDYTGDPVTSTGVLDWQPADKRILLSSGPFTLYAGNTQEVIVACIGAVGTDRLDAVTKLKESTKLFQEFYNRPQMSVSQTKGIKKFKTPVRISVSNVDGLLGADFKIYYDNSILELKEDDVKLTPLTNEFTYSVNVNQNQGIVGVALAGSSPLDSELSDILVKLPFNVMNSASIGNYSDLIFNEAELTFQSDSLTTAATLIINGGLEVVEEELFGDVNQSGDYDLIDVVLILKAVVEMYDEFTPFQELLADANKNGILAVNDALKVLDELVLNKLLGKSGKTLASMPDTTVDVKLCLLEIQGEIGEEVIVPVLMEESGQLLGLDIEFRYDQSAIILESIQQAQSNDLVAGNLQNTGYAHIAVVNREGMGNEQGELVKLVFKINKKSKHNLTIINSEGVKAGSNLSNTIPAEYALYQNYPNPFNPSTTIKFDLPEAAHVVMKIYSLLGEEVAILINEEKQAGRYTLNFNASGLASGVYIYRLKANDFVNSKKTILLK